jgi:tRNA dimethylallyltransferase
MAGKKVLVIAGPTASGKSDLALELAEEFGGVVINADAMQIYEGLEVITASPKEAARTRAPHKLYGVWDPAISFSAGQWVGLAKQEIQTAHQAGFLPIVVGGTGMYLQALIKGIAAMPAIPSSIRENVRSRLLDKGSVLLHAELSKFDPKTAARLNVSDSQRIARAIEIFEATGKSLTQWHVEGIESETSPEFKFRSVLLKPRREILYAACDVRFEEMLRTGALDEVAALVNRNLDPNLPAMKALGIPEIIKYLAGELLLEEAVLAGQQTTRRYVKRQGTWFKNQFIADIVIKSKYNNILNHEIFPFISKFLLT